MKTIFLSLAILTISFGVKAQTKFFTNGTDTLYTPNLDGKYRIDSVIHSSSITAMKTVSEVIKPYLNEYIEFKGDSISRYYVIKDSKRVAFNAAWNWTGYGFPLGSDFPLLDKTIKVKEDSTGDYEMKIVVGGDGFGFDKYLAEGSIKIKVYSTSKTDNLVGINYVAYEYYLTKVSKISNSKLSGENIKELRKDFHMMNELNKK